MVKIDNSQIIRLLEPYGFVVGPELAGKIAAYIDLLLRWNRKISLTAITDPVEIVKFHFGESLFAISALPITQGRLADVGSGAGFPGLPLAMALPGLQVTLIESNAKKAAFLHEVSRELNLKNVEAFRGRAADLPAAIPAFDFIAARAVGHHAELLAWSKSRLATSAVVVLWLGLDDALLLASEPGWECRPKVAIPGSAKRCLLVGRPLVRFP